ncbi:protein TolQ [methane-oxidizing endosymbiont of Gigantopelta aegis]|uniref:protein TolQ n=1 Tax=methane-oxidizing endosymbiont of Gigantopelta aegis TaxID=2794938 RepID=UPI0018DB2179|nr:protein TolQ [methane-oxidizing endosymbiont of Gigantopelta aegis]
MNSEISFLDLILNASFVVQFVMLLLLLASVMSWTYIFSKRAELKQAERIAEDFEEKFWSGVELSTLVKDLKAREEDVDGIENIFLAGYKAFARMAKQEGISPEVKIESAQRAMKIELARELDKLDESLPFLATVGSTSPYIGLFGTVWGIMNAFSALGEMKQATLANVAPGISEALIATAMGLFAAIPAVIAYNRFSTQLDRLAGRYELFMDEFLVVLQRQVHQS